MATHPYVLLDVFTDRPFAGNQLAVFPDADGIDDALMAVLALELNLSETVFVLPPRDGGDARMRIFSTVTELPFAGHPTLGTAALLAARGSGRGDPGLHSITLETGRGPVPVDVRVSPAGTLSGWMEQPIPTIAPWQATDELCEIMRVDPPTLPVEVYDNGIKHLFAVLESPEQVEAIEPDFAALGRLCGRPVRINVSAGAGTAYTTRMFSPFDRVPEDPACGSAAGPLGVHLVRHGRLPYGQTLTISQGAQVNRPSTLYSHIVGRDGGIDQVRVGGGVVIVGSGEFTV